MKQDVPKKITPFRVFLRELKQRKVDMATCFLAVACIAVSTRMVTLKNEKKWLDCEHEERMADLQDDNRKLRKQLSDLQERVMHEAGRQGRKLEPLSSRMNRVFDDFFHRPSTAQEAPKEEEKKQRSGRFFV